MNSKLNKQPLFGLGKAVNKACAFVLKPKKAFVKAFLILMLTSFGFWACSPDDVSFEADILDPGLPRYTDTGKNIAACQRPNGIWLSDFAEFFSLTAQVPNYRDNLRFYRRGERTWVGLSGEDSEERSGVLILVELMDLSGFEDQDIAVLDGREIALNPNNTWILSARDEFYIDTIGYATEGFFRFQQLNVNAEKAQVSGTFGFDAITQDTLSFFHEGRFDFALSTVERITLSSSLLQPLTR